MSAIASFYRIPVSAIAGLRLAALPQKKLFGGTRDVFYTYLTQNGQIAAAYNWSGYVFGTLLPYLHEHHQIDLAHSEHDDLSAFLTEVRGASCFILTGAHKNQYLLKLSGEFSQDELRDYCNEFNGSNEAYAGEPMLDGIRCLRESLTRLDDQSIILLVIG
jgi:hypothetical protein